MKSLVRFLDRCRPGSILGLGVALVAVIGVLDYLSNPEIAFALFYILPVALVSWYVQRPAGLWLAALAAVAWTTVEYSSGPRYVYSYALYWNGFMRLATFLIIAYLVSRLRERLQREQELAARDLLTGLYNTRIFYIHVDEEISRSQRYGSPFTLAYLSISDIKKYETRRGAQAVRELLCAVADSMRRHTRPMDTLARVGEDEFAIVFVESGQEAAQDSMRRIHHALIELAKQRAAPLTFSVGMAVYTDRRDSLSELMRRADDALHKAKKAGKSRIVCLAGTETARHP